jgi:hypothetical protein
MKQLFANGLATANNRHPLVQNDSKESLGLSSQRIDSPMRYLKGLQTLEVKQIKAFSNIASAWNCPNVPLKAAQDLQTSNRALPKSQTEIFRNLVIDLSRQGNRGKASKCSNPN